MDATSLVEAVSVAVIGIKTFEKWNPIYMLWVLDSRRSFLLIILTHVQEVSSTSSKIAFHEVKLLRLVNKYTGSTTQYFFKHFISTRSLSRDHNTNQDVENLIIAAETLHHTWN